MSNDPPQNANQRIRELEEQVARLTRELESLRAEKRSVSTHGRRIGDQLPKPPPLLGHTWTIRAIMLIMTAAIAGAVAANYSPQDFDPRHVTAYGRGMAGQRVDFVLLTCGLCALLSLFLYRRRTLAFAFFALCAFYPVFALYLLLPPPHLSIGERAYAWTAFSALVVWNVLVSMLCVMESRRIGRGRGRSAFVGTINCLAFYPLVWHGLRVYGSSHTGFVYTALGAIAVLLAIYAESIGPHRNYLFQIFAGAALLLFNFALHAVLTGGWLLGALALECLALAALYHATGIVIFKAANVVLLIATFALAVQAAKFTAPMYVGARTIQTNWAQGLFTSAIFLAASWYYARHVRGVKPQHRKLSGHWFLADTAFDIPPSTVSLLHAAGAALLLTLLAISDLGNLSALPFLLAAASAAMAVLGMALRTPQIEVSAVMLVIAAHVSFYFFLAVQKEGFRDQPYFALYTALLAAYTFIGGYRTERFLARIGGGRGTDHHASASVPYMVAVGSAAVLVHRYTGPLYAPCALAMVALLLGATGVGLRAAGLKLGAVAAMCVACGMWFYELLQPAHLLNTHPWLWPMAATLTVAAITVERFVPWRQRGGPAPGAIDHIAQIVALAVAGGIGAGTLALSSDPEWRAVLMFAHALLWIALCMFVCDVEYRWTALLILTGSAAWLAFQQRAAQPGSSITLLIACAGVFLAILIAVWVLVPKYIRHSTRFAAGK